MQLSCFSITPTVWHPILEVRVNKYTAMERTLELAAKGNFGDSKALENLGLSNVAQVDFEDLCQIDKGTLETILTLCAKGAMAGKCL